MLRQLMIYYIKVYSLPRSQAMRFDSKHQSHCLSCIFSQKIQFAFVDCSSICKQCLCAHKGQNTHGLANLPCVFCLLGCNPQSLLSSRFRDGCALLWSAERAFCKNAQPASARCSSRVWDFPTSILKLDFEKSNFKNRKLVPTCTACCECERLLNCKMIFQLLYWAYQSFFGRMPQ